MADSNFWCRECQKNTDHTDIRESRIYICADCGIVTKFKLGYKMPIKEPVKISTFYVSEKPTSDTPDKIAKMGCHKKGKQGGEVATGSGLKQQLSRMVADAVDQRLAGLGLDTLDAKMRMLLLGCSNEKEYSKNTYL